MRALLVLLMASGVMVIGCGQTADAPVALQSPASPTLAVGSGEAAAKAAAPGDVEVPFHSAITWTKVVNGGDAGPCQGLHGDPPNGMIYLMRNASEGPAVTTHLGAGDFEIHTCVYGTMVGETKRPAGWRADLRWTAANGDVLLATSQFLYWTGQPGRSVAVDSVTFQDGGSGRFAFAEGSGLSYVNAPEGTAIYEATLRYGKTEK